MADKREKTVEKERRKFDQNTFRRKVEGLEGTSLTEVETVLLESWDSVELALKRRTPKSQIYRAYLDAGGRSGLSNFYRILNRLASRYTSGPKGNSGLDTRKVSSKGLASSKVRDGL